MVSICMKRLGKERERFPADDSEFWVNWNDENLRTFEAYIVGTDDSVYKYKLVKLRFDIPDNYPIVPPKVTFIQHTGDRIHPNLYTDGKVCLSILGTWQGPGWASNMNVESVLRTLRSLLDQRPYMHEPGQADRPEYNEYVRYHSWRWLLLDYLERETSPAAKTWLDKHMNKFGSNIVVELERQRDAMRHNGRGAQMTSPYARQARHTADYERLVSEVKQRMPRVLGRVLGSTNHPTTTAQPGDEARPKRKLPFDANYNDHSTMAPPSKKPCSAGTSTEIIDLTGD